MRFFISIILIFFGTYQVSAQHEWAPIGAEWYYSYREGAATPATGYFHLRTLKDTLIGSKECKVIAKSLVNSTGETSFQGYEYIYSDIDGNMVYRYLFEEFYLLYDFNKKTGDTLVVKVPSSATKLDSITLVVDSVSQINLSDTVTLRTLNLKQVFGLSSSGFKFNGKIIERIGNLFYFFPYYEIDCDGGCPQPLRCYSDTRMNYISYQQYPCDTIYTYNKPIPELNIKIYPNPFQDYIIVEHGLSNFRYYDIELFNNSGILILRKKYSSNKIIIDMSEYPKGIYPIKISNGYNEIFKKIVKF